MPGIPPTRACIRCGAPRPARALKYCAVCALTVGTETRRQARKRQLLRERAERAAEASRRAKLPGKRPAPPSPPGTWTAADVVRCRGCKYWRPLGFCGPACHYPIDTGRLRPMRPRDCYGHAGTPYTPER